MKTLSKIYIKSKDIIERKIKDEIIIIPATSEVVNLENATLFTLNDIAKEIWSRIDNKKSVAEIIEEIWNIYEVDKNKLTNDIIELLDELIKKGLIS